MGDTHSSFYITPFISLNVQVKGVRLNNSGSFPLKDKEFLLDELKRHFDKERMFVISPNVDKELSAAARAIADERLMDDLKFKEDTGSKAPVGPNEVVCRYFSKMLPRWGKAGQQQVAFKDILAEFNHDHEGMYRRTCILPFMQPLIESGVVEVRNSDTLCVHVGSAAAYFQK